METKYCYTKIIVLGSGKLAWQCAVTGSKYIQNVEVLEYKVTDSTVLKKLCEKEGLAYFCCDRDQLFQRLSRESEQTLVVSAGNTYLIPGEVVHKSNLTIINWHNALLPAHRGRNAEAWCIFEGDAETGITWHMLVEKVDAGDVLAQEKIVIDDRVTALQLFQKQCRLGVEVFDRFVESLLEGRCSLTAQADSDRQQLHLSRDIPGGGCLDTEWGYDRMSRFLRSMDYGSLRLLGDMYVEWEGETYSFYKYKLEEADRTDGAEWQDGDLILYRGGHKIVLKGLKRERGTENER